MKRPEYYLPLLNDQMAKIMHYSIRSLPRIYNSPVAPPAKNYESAFPLLHALKQYNVKHSYQHPLDTQGLGV